MMEYINIEGFSIHRTAGERHTFTEFKMLFPTLKDAEKAYIALGGTIKKVVKKKKED